MSNFENKIKATDLRIGDWINSPRGISKIIEIGFKNNEYYLRFEGLHERYWLLDCSPIPLTEDWLLKLGFSSEEYRDKRKHIGINFGQTDFTLVKPGSLDFKHIKHFGFEFDAGGWPRLKQFEYVHELQNFFYCYSGEELEVKI